MLLWLDGSRWQNTAGFTQKLTWCFCLHFSFCQTLWQQLQHWFGVKGTKPGMWTTGKFNMKFQIKFKASPAGLKINHFGSNDEMMKITMCIWTLDLAFCLYCCCCCKKICMSFAVSSRTSRCTSGFDSSSYIVLSCAFLTWGVVDKLYRPCSVQKDIL